MKFLATVAKSKTILLATWEFFWLTLAPVKHNIKNIHVYLGKPHVVWSERKILHLTVTLEIT